MQKVLCPYSKIRFHITGKMVGKSNSLTEYRDLKKDCDVLSVAFTVLHEVAKEEHQQITDHSLSLF